jgi:predicted acyltransferase
MAGLATAGRAPRLVSLDAFRGATIAFMILVNTAGDGSAVYWPLRHAEWNGWTPTDVVFPSFLWIAGVALTLSFRRRLAAGLGRGVLLRQAFRRAVILYALGLLVYAYPAFDLSTFRIMGVLQRIAICYLAGSAIWLWSARRGRIAWVVALLAGYWLLMMYAPVPGYGAGRLDVEGNFAHYVDAIVLGRHNYAHTVTWDPEGIVSTLPAIATLLFGTLAGDELAREEALGRRLWRVAAAGSLLLAVGLVASHWLPINKKLWTSSFALFMAGLDGLLFALTAWLVDIRGWTRAVRPFVIFGMNAITVYMAAELLDITLDALHVRRGLYEAVFAPLASPVNASLLYALAYTGLMYLLAWSLYRRGRFLSV